MKTVISITTDRGSGGIANSLLSYSKALALIDCKHILIAPADAAVLNDIKHCSNVDTILFKKWLLKLHIFSGFVFCPDIRKKLATAEAILLHNAKLCRPLKQFHNTVVINHSGKPRYLEHARQIIFLTKAAKERFNSGSEDRETDIKQFIIGHGFEDFADKLADKTHSETVRIIAAGRYVNKKRFQDLIAAANLLNEERLPVEIHIYGQGPLKEELQVRIQRDQLNNVFIHGWATNLHEKFRQSDIFCLTSSEEPFGLVIGEAMLCELPVVTTDTDGPLDLLGSEDPQAQGGIIYPAGDVKALAAALSGLSVDSELRTKIGKAGRNNILDHFSIDALASKLNTMLTSLG